MAQFVANNHSCPQAYLRGWSADGTHVWARRLLVPAAAYPEWTHQAVRSLTAYAHLYTSVRSGVPSDDRERWLKREFEDPAAEALRSVRQDRPVGKEDFDRLAYYAAALHLRTPASYLEHTERWQRQVPGLLRETLARAKREMKQASRDARHPPRIEEQQNKPSWIRVSVDRSAGPGKAEIKAEICVNREMWLDAMEHLLTNTVPVLREHDWTILKPYPGSQWFTCDHPSIRLNYFDADRYDFGGGWGNPGSEILLPLSPQHLLYTQIGQEALPRGPLSLEQTLLVQRLIAEHAHRWIIADGQPMRAVWFRERMVNLEAYSAEEEQWVQWNAAQSASVGVDPLLSPSEREPSERDVA